MEYLRIVIVIFYVASAASYSGYFFFQKKYFQKAGYFLILGGFVLHSFLIGYPAVKDDCLPARNLHETLSLAAWSLSGVFLFLRYRFNLKIMGIYAAPLAAGTMIASSAFHGTPYQGKTLFNSLWLVIHVVTVFIGEASFALACGVGILYLVQENAIKTKNNGFIYKRLPSLELLDSTGYGCLVTGFTFLTLGLVVGFAYAKIAWGRFWTGDIKEIWSLGSWLVYAALLHQRLTVGWRGKRAAIMAIIGFLLLVFTFLGVNFLLKGHHGQFTRF